MRVKPAEQSSTYIICARSPVVELVWVGVSVLLGDEAKPKIVTDTSHRARFLFSSHSMHEIIFGSSETGNTAELTRVDDFHLRTFTVSFDGETAVII